MPKRYTSVLSRRRVAKYEAPGLLFESGFFSFPSFPETTMPRCHQLLSDDETLGGPSHNLLFPLSAGTEQPATCIEACLSFCWVPTQLTACVRSKDVYSGITSGIAPKPLAYYRYHCNVRTREVFGEQCWVAEPSMPSLPVAQSCQCAWLSSDRFSCLTVHSFPSHLLFDLRAKKSFLPFLFECSFR